MRITKIDPGRFIGSLEHRLFEDDLLMASHIHTSLQQKRGLSPIIWGIHFSLARDTRLPSLSRLVQETREDIGLVYGFLGKSVLRGRTLDKLGVPNVCGGIDPSFLKMFEPIMGMMTRVSERRMRMDMERKIGQLDDVQNPNNAFVLKIKTDDKSSLKWLPNPSFKFLWTEENVFHPDFNEAMKNRRAPNSRYNDKNSNKELERDSNDLLETILDKFKMAQISCPGKNDQIKNSRFGSNQNIHNSVGSTGEMINLTRKKKISDGKIKMAKLQTVRKKVTLEDTINKIRHSLENKKLNKKPVPRFKPMKNGRANNFHKIKKEKDAKVRSVDDNNNICLDLNGLMNTFGSDPNQTIHSKTFQTLAAQTRPKNKKRKLFSQTSDNGISSQTIWKSKEKPKRQTKDPTVGIQREVSPKELIDSSMEVMDNTMKSANRNSENVKVVERKVYAGSQIDVKENLMGAENLMKEMSVRTPILSSNSYVLLGRLTDLNHSLHYYNFQSMSKAPGILCHELEVEKTASVESNKGAMEYETTERNVDDKDFGGMSNVEHESAEPIEEQNSAKEVTENINELSLNEAVSSEVKTERNLNEKDFREVTVTVFKQGARSPELIEKHDSTNEIKENRDVLDNKSVRQDKQSSFDEHKEHDNIDSVRPNKKDSSNKRHEKTNNVFNTKLSRPTVIETLQNKIFEKNSDQIEENKNQFSLITLENTLSREVVESFKTPLDTSSCRFESKHSKAHTLPKQKEYSMSQGRRRTSSTAKMDKQKMDDESQQKPFSLVENIKKILSNSKQIKDKDKFGILKTLEDMQSFSLSPPSDEETNLWSLKPSASTINSVKPTNETSLAELNSRNVTADEPGTVALDEMDLEEVSSSTTGNSKLSSISKMYSEKRSPNLDQLETKYRTVSVTIPDLEEESNMDDGSVSSLNSDDQIYHSQQISSDSVATKDKPAALNTQQFKAIGFDSPEEEVQNFQEILDDGSKKATPFPNRRNLIIDQTSSVSQPMAKPELTQRDTSKAKSVKSKIADILNEAVQYSSSSSSESYKKLFFTHKSGSVANNQNKNSDANFIDAKTAAGDYLNNDTQPSASSSNGSYRKLLEKHNYDTDTSETFFDKISDDDTSNVKPVTSKMTTTFNPAKKNIANILSHNSTSTSNESYRKLLEKHNYTDTDTSETIFSNISGEDTAKTKVVIPKVTNMLNPVKFKISNILNQAIQDSTSSSNESYRKLIATKNYDTDTSQTSQSNQDNFFDDD